MPRKRDESRDGERLFALFLLGAVLFSPLMIGIFDVGADSSVFGIPALYLYLFAGWALLIGLVGTVVESAPKESIRHPEGASPPSTYR